MLAIGDKVICIDSSMAHHIVAELKKDMPNWVVKGKKYIIEPYKADISIYDELKENLTLDVYNGFIGFFLRIQQTLLSCTLNSLMEMDLTPKMKKDLAESGVGSPGFMNSVMETLQNKT